jgi:hypothetical protein
MPDLFQIAGPDGANRTQARSLCYITLLRRHCGCTAITSEMALRITSGHGVPAIASVSAKISELAFVLDKALGSIRKCREKPG